MTCAGAPDVTVVLSLLPIAGKRLRISCSASDTTFSARLRESSSIARMYSADRANGSAGTTAGFDAATIRTSESIDRAKIVQHFSIAALLNSEPSVAIRTLILEPPLPGKLAG